MTKNMSPNQKYNSYPPFPYPDRSWPDKRHEFAPTWCSVDLRDGNQALINPMTLDQKLNLFRLLVDIGFKEIEVGFPAAAEVEYDFLRKLIDDKLIPDDVHIQVLCQAREHLIEKTFDAIKGAKNVIFHLYNSTSTAQREIVFKKDKEEIKKIATDGTKWVQKYAKNFGGNLRFQYSPESFTGTEPAYALEVCEAVMEIWKDEIILNLPATVELSTPNIYADLIEWFSKTIKERNRVILSVHTHNDRGTGIAATELAMLAGAERVEGTLFGNGERTGNVDIITLALNLFTGGIDPKLDLKDLPEIVKTSDKCTNIPVHVRHPYAGELVFTAFSGSHQDAIKKGMTHQLQKEDDAAWNVPYLAIDPTDIGRSYEAIIRINSQSGKGGMAYILETEYGIKLPKSMHPDFAKAVQKEADKTGRELPNDTIFQIFKQSYIDTNTPIAFKKFKSTQTEDDAVKATLVVTHQGEEKTLTGTGNGPIDAAKDALQALIPNFSIETYEQHALKKGSSAQSIAYIGIQKDSQTSFGAGIHTNINTASIKALISAINRL